MQLSNSSQQSTPIFAPSVATELPLFWDLNSSVQSMDMPLYQNTDTNSLNMYTQNSNEILRSHSTRSCTPLNPKSPMHTGLMFSDSSNHLKDMNRRRLLRGGGCSVASRGSISNIDTASYHDYDTAPNALLPPQMPVSSCNTDAASYHNYNTGPLPPKMPVSSCNTDAASCHKIGASYHNIDAASSQNIDAASYHNYNTGPLPPKMPVSSCNTDAASCHKIGASYHNIDATSSQNIDAASYHNYNTGSLPPKMPVSSCNTDAASCNHDVASCNSNINAASCHNIDAASYHNIDAASYPKINTSSCHNIDAASYHNIDAASYPKINTSSCQNINASSCHNIDASSCHNIDVTSHHNIDATSCPNIDATSHHNINTSYHNINTSYHNINTSYHNINASSCPNKTRPLVPKVGGGLWQSAVETDPHTSVVVLSPTQLSIGDCVIFEGDRGFDLGRVAYTRHPGPKAVEAGNRALYLKASNVDQIKHQMHRVPRFVRMAHREECSRWTDIIPGLSEKAKEICNEICRNNNLPLEVVSARYQFDGQKLSFLFISENPVDFRFILPILFKEFQCRIWMDRINTTK